METLHDFLYAARTHPYLLAEGAVLERVRRSRPELLDPHVLNASMVYSEDSRQVLKAIYKEYLAIGAAYDLPMIILAPTWRASQARLKAAGFSDTQDVNGDCVRFVREIVAEYGSYASEVYVGGLIACANDAYKPQETLTRQAAAEYHAFHAEALANAGVDFIMAATLPAFDEALGMADVLGRFKPPYILSFVVRAGGGLLDRTPLWKAIDKIDTLAEIPPAYYMINCVHPEHFASAVTAQSARHPHIDERILGLQANTSRLSPEKLDSLDHLDESDPEHWAFLLRHMSKVWPMKVIGGCCGTDGRHIACLARELVEEIDEAEIRRARVW